MKIQQTRKCSAHRLTQHKRFVPYGTHPNFCRAKTSFMLGTLQASRRKKDNDRMKEKFLLHKDKEEK